LAGRAVPPSPDEAHSPLLIYRWSETTAELDRALEAGGGTVARVEFVSPQSRGPVMATLGCAMIRIAGGARTAPFRATGSSIYVVRSGAGRSVIAGVEMSWTEGDIFVSPSWTAVEHLGESKSDLFVVSDRPVLEALHLYREELLDEPQLVEEKFNRCRTS
ncbi:MAG: cupin domain-containing protein, partial [Acidimicrobiales bacterium]